MFVIRQLISLHRPENAVKEGAIHARLEDATTLVDERHDPQLTKLRESFAREAYPTRKVKEALATQFGCTFDQVKRWFERQR